IQRQTGYEFLYNDQVGDSVSRVTLHVQNASIRDVLDLCFQGQPFTYEIVEKAVVIQRKAPALDPDKPQAVVTAVGTVFNEQGQPLGGANVVDKRTNRATITNPKGMFQFPGLEAGSTLIVTYVGYLPQEVKIKDGTAQIIYMKVAKNDLDKIVVQAYGNTSQRLTTSDISTVSAAEIERQPVANVLTALQGNVPGMVVQQVNGYASAPFKVEIRGRTQLDPTRPSEPLYVIDGVPLTVLESGKGGNYASGSTGFNQNGMTGPAGGQSPIFSLNPNDIESVSVLKDADATAIYGSRGANGVILITTKSGKSGKAAFDVNFYEGASKVTKHYSMLNTQQYLMVRREAFKNDNITPNTGNAWDLLTWDTTRYTDLQNELWAGIGRTADAQASLTAGDKQNSLRLSGSFHRETDIMTASGANQRSSAQFNVTHLSLDQRLNISFTSTYSYSNINIKSYPGQVTLPPDLPKIYSAPGKINWSGWTPNSNPFGVLLQPYQSKTGFLNSRIHIQYSVIGGLSIAARLGYSTTHEQQSYLTPIVSQNPAYNPTGSSSFGNNNNTNAIIEPELQYKKAIWKGTLNAQFGGSFQSVEQDGNILNGLGYVNDNLIRSIANAPVKQAADNNSEYKYIAGYARINYNLLNKYIINVSARRDGSSRFGPGRQFGNFGAVGAAWLFSDEKWVKENLSFLSFGKIRGSYGVTGSDNIGDYQFLSAWTSQQNTYINGSPAYLTANLSNPDLEWQVNKKLEAAIDLGFFQDRLLISLAWYRDRSSNELISTPLPTQTGFSNITQNLQANIQNTGLEGTIKAKIIEAEHIHWSASFDIGANRNKLISFPNLAQSPYASQFTVGKPLTNARLLHYTGVDPQTGLYTFTDRNHDGNINTNPNDTANDLFVKDLTVKFDGGFGTHFDYKGVNLDLFFRFRKQFLPSIYKTMAAPGVYSNVPTEVLNRWQKPGDHAEFAKFTTQQSTTNFNFSQYSDGVYTNGNFIRLQNVSLSYDLTQSILKNSKIKGCSIFIHGENLFLLTKYKGLDPETPVFGAMPPAKIYVGGVQFSL
ncbi:MAG TPA: SusC/RagA family TonB-linked outer membrane protein, partial [Mucilaginibacter sp.]